MYRFAVIGAMPTPSKKTKKNDPSYRRVGTSRYPCERRLTFTIGAGATILVDVAKALSAQNHRLYRQGKLYHCRVELTDLAPQSGDLIKQAVTLFTIPDTWYVKKAWELGFATREEQLTNSNRPRGRWDDFRVGWSSAYQTGTLPNTAILGSTQTADEAQLAKVHDATASADYGFVMFGSNRDSSNNLYGLIEQYDHTGNTLQDPGASGTGAYTNVHADAGLVEAAGDLSLAQGDNAPYDMDSFNGADDGGAVMQPALSTTEDGVGRSSVSFMAPLGLIKLVNASTGGSAVATAVTISVSPGNYKGVKALDW